MVKVHAAEPTLFGHWGITLASWYASNAIWRTIFGYIFNCFHQDHFKEIAGPVHALKMRKKPFAAGASPLQTALGELDQRSHRPLAAVQRADC